MKKYSTLCASIIAAIIICAPASAGVITFDDTGTSGAGPIPNGYAGFNWDNFFVLNAMTYDVNPSGYLNGLVSPEHVAFNAYAEPAEFTGNPFNFIGAYLTGAWNDGLNISIEGYRGGLLVHSQNVVVDSDGPTWVQANFLNVDKVRFTSFGGTPNPNFGGGGSHFAMDNLLCTAVPAPGGLLLASLGAGVVGWFRRRRTL